MRDAAMAVGIEKHAWKYMQKKKDSFRHGVGMFNGVDFQDNNHPVILSKFFFG